MHFMTIPHGNCLFEINVILQYSAQTIKANTRYDIQTYCHMCMCIYNLIYKNIYLKSNSDTAHQKRQVDRKRKRVVLLLMVN